MNNLSGVVFVAFDCQSGYTIMMHTIHNSEIYEKNNGNYVKREMVNHSPSCKQTQYTRNYRGHAMYKFGNIIRLKFEFICISS